LLLWIQQPLELAKAVVAVFLQDHSSTTFQV
jgi:hypothetical protein